MDSRSFNSQAETFESSSRMEPCRVFTYYHPHYQPECSIHQDDQYASFIFGDCDCLGESAYYASSVSKPCFESHSFLGPPRDHGADFLNIRPTTPAASTRVMDI